MKIKLIAPARKPEWGESFLDLKTLCKLTNRKTVSPPLALITLAAITPFDIEISITDESVEQIDFDEKVNLVGITGMSCVIPRAYEIADEYRKRGVTVVMGGIHVSMLPEEAITHCDSVVIGEAEDIWGQVIKDAKDNKLQKFYRTDGFPALTNSPVPRWDLLKNDKYCYFSIQTARGCPFDCDFCSVKVFNGRKCRHKKIEQVIKEAEEIKRIDAGRSIFFVDDNLMIIPKHAEEVMKELIPLGISSWWCQSSLNSLANDRMLDLMYQAGCRGVLIGLESISQKSLENMNKGWVNKVVEYEKIIDKIHSHRIGVLGSFILGTDVDDESIFDETLKFIDRTNIVFSMINIMTPPPGTKLYEKLEKEGRILHKNWEKYNGENICFIPKLIREEKLNRGHEKIVKQIYSYDQLYKRFCRLWDKGTFVRKNNRFIKRFSKGRFIFSVGSVLNFKNKRTSFILKSLWNKHVTSPGAVSLALSYHDYSEVLDKK